jgi:hypothetical protein
VSEEHLVNWYNLQAPFDASEIEWRVGSSGLKQGGVWARVFAYVTNRAIQNRLDDILGPAGWSNEFKPGPNGGVICGLAIRCEEHGAGMYWLTKWDGADARDFEPVKSALSDSMKRAACQWGIGRYLYELESGFADVVEKGTWGAQYAKTQDGTQFYWLPPPLPEWALPAGEEPGEANTKPAQASPDPSENQEPVEKPGPDQLRHVLRHEIGCTTPEEASLVVHWLWEGKKDGIDDVQNDEKLADATLVLLQHKADDGTPVDKMLEEARSYVESEVPF